MRNSPVTKGSAETLQPTPCNTLITAPAMDIAMGPGKGQVVWAAWLSFGAEPGKQSHREMRLAGRRDVTGGVRSTTEVLQA